jgi:2-polyprenyl-3-methyl-5-hydroxy-6-metoxy-1,4-benzoquinol methylase
MSDATDYWKNNYKRVTGSNEDYYLAIHPDGSPFINEFFHAQKLKVFNKMLSVIQVAKNLKALDFGCGTGVFSESLHSRGMDVSAIDVSEDLICRNKKSNSEIDYFLSSGQDLEFSDCEFDVINSMMVLQHIPDDVKKNIVKEFSRVIKKGGHVMMVESIYLGDRSSHMFSLSKEEWIELFELNGFKLEYFHGVEYVLIRRIFYYMLGLVVGVKNMVFKKEHVNESELDSNLSNSMQMHSQLSVKSKVKNIIENGLIAVSYLFETFFWYFLPGKYAVRGAFVFKKVASE